MDPTRIHAIRQQIIDAVDENQQFYISRWLGKYSVHTLSPHSSWKQRVLFQMGKQFSSSTNELAGLLKFSIGEKSGDLAKLVDKIERNYLPHTTFFHSQRAMRNNRRLRQVVHLAKENLVSKNLVDLETATQQIQKIVNSAFEKKEKIVLGLAETIGQGVNFPNAHSIVNKGGTAIFATLSEKRMLLSDAYKDVKKNLKGKDREQLESYERAVHRSYDLNLLIAGLVIDTYQANLPNVAKKAFDQIDSLEKEEFLLLDIKVKGHAMRAVVKNEGETLSFDLYDSGGGIDMLRFPTPESLYHDLIHKKRALALSMQVPRETFKKEGQAFLEQVYFFTVPPKEGTSETHWNARTAENFFSLWKSLAKTKFLHKREKLQESATCFAERIDATQRKLLPEGVYLRLVSLRYQEVENRFIALAKKDLGNEWCPPSKGRLTKNLWRKYQKQLNRMTGVPKTQEEWEVIFFLLFHKKESLEEKISIGVYKK